MRRRSIGFACALAVLAAAVLAAQAPPAGRSPAQKMSPDLRKKLLESLERGAAYERQQQKPDGTWENHPGITGTIWALGRYRSWHYRT